MRWLVPKPENNWSSLPETGILGKAMIRVRMTQYQSEDQIERPGPATKTIYVGIMVMVMVMVTHPGGIMSTNWYWSLILAGLCQPIGIGQ